MADHFDADDRRSEHPPCYNIAPEDDRGLSMIGCAREDRLGDPWSALEMRWR